MCSVRFAVWSMLGLFGLTVVSDHTAVARDRYCDRCFLSVPAPAMLYPVVVAEPVPTTQVTQVVTQVTQVVTQTTQVVVVAPVESETKLVVNCPAAARVTIDGRVTHAAGKSRQYRLLFHGDDHKIRVGIRLRHKDANGDSATYDFDQAMGCRRNQTITLSVTLKQMQKTEDPRPAEKTSDSPHPPECSPAASGQISPAQSGSPLKQTVEYQTGLLRKQQSALKNITEDVRAKTTRRDAAVRIRKQTDDAYQMKIVEVNAAKSDSAAIWTGKVKEAKKLELDLKRTREVEQETIDELAAALHQQSKAQEPVVKAEAALEGLKRRYTVERLTKNAGTEQAEMQRLAEIIGTQKLRLNAADQLLKLAVENQKPELEISLARELVESAKTELADAQAQWNQAQESARQALETLRQFKAGEIHIELD